MICGVYEALTTGCEITNNLAVAIEILIATIVGSIIGFIFYKREKEERRKLDRIIEEQNKIRTARTQFIIDVLKIHLGEARKLLPTTDEIQLDVNTAISPKSKNENAMNKPLGRYLWCLVHLENIDKTLNEYLDILEPEEVRKIRQLSDFAARVKKALKDKIIFEQVDGIDEKRALEMPDEFMKMVNDSFDYIIKIEKDLHNSNIIT